MARASSPTKRKSVASYRGRNATILAEEKHIGRETVNFEGLKPEELERKMIETLRHYSYFYDAKEGIKWASAWVKKNYSKDDYNAFKRAETWRTSMTVCSLCKMIENGAPFDEQRISWIRKHIDQSIKAGYEKQASTDEDDDTVTVRKKSPAEILKEKTSEYIGEIEGIIDTFGTDEFDKEYSLFTDLRKNDVAYNTAKAIVDAYTPLVDEFKELTGPKKKNDDMYDQLVEGYSHMTKKSQKEFLKFIQSLVDDATSYMATKKAKRKTRAPKVKSAAQQVSSLKYLKESAEYKIASVDPQNIIGASVLYMLNTKTRTLTRIESTASVGLGVKGTTIINFDDDKCLKKKLRKPEDFLSAVSKTTKTKINKEWNALTTKPAEANGRVNADTIILKVF
jgi:hypothetical protein